MWNGVLINPCTQLTTSDISSNKIVVCETAQRNFIIISGTLETMHDCLKGLKSKKFIFSQSSCLEVVRLNFEENPICYWNVIAVVRLITYLVSSTFER